MFASREIRPETPPRSACGEDCGSCARRAACASIDLAFLAAVDPRGDRAGAAREG